LREAPEPWFRGFFVVAATSLRDFLLRARRRPTRICWWLRALLLCLCVLLASTWLLWQRGLISSVVAGFLAVLLLLPHAPILAMEFALAWAIRPRPSLAWGGELLALARAWAHEVCLDLLMFAWRQAFAEHLVPDALSPDRAAGVVLVHGYGCNRGFWSEWLLALDAHHFAALAPSFSPPFGCSEDWVAELDTAICRVTALTGRPPVVVAHSMGGLVVRAWMAGLRAEGRVAAVVTLATPHLGTWLARFAWSANGRQMRLGAAWLAALLDREALSRTDAQSRYASFLCFHSDLDNVVFPLGTATLPGADNRLVSGVGHVELVVRAECLAAVLDLLEGVANSSKPSPAG